MKLINLFALLACLSTLAGKAQLIECHPRGGLPNFFAKLKQGGPVRIGYLGGSVSAQEGWRPKTLQWFQQQYPQAGVSQINAAVGGTGSDLGVFRLRRDVLDQKPDLLFVEFSVNDFRAPPEQIYRAMEGIVRQTWRDNPTTDICFIYIVASPSLEALSKGELPPSYAAMEKIAEHYGIPSINAGLEVARLAQAGKLILTGAKPKTDAEKAALGGKILFSPDGFHPYIETGHQLYLEAIVRGMNAIKPVGTAAPHQLIKPFIADNWENARLISLDHVNMSGRWTQLNPATNSVAKKFANRLPVLWRANQPGDSIQFKFRGTMAAIYDIIGPDCGQVVVTLDDQKPVLRPQFDAYYRLAPLSIGSNLSNSVHTVKIEIYPDQPDKAKILSQRQEKMDDPKRFDDRAWYPGDLMLVGDLVK
jgi:lysophospholipase L1-like esterase